MQFTTRKLYNDDMQCQGTSLLTSVTNLPVS